MYESRLWTLSKQSPLAYVLKSLWIPFQYNMLIIFVKQYYFSTQGFNFCSEGTKWSFFNWISAPNYNLIKIIFLCEKKIQFQQWVLLALRPLTPCLMIFHPLNSSVVTRNRWQKLLCKTRLFFIFSPNIHQKF